MTFSNFAEKPFIEKKPGIFMKVLTGQNMQLAYGHLEPETTTLHSHPNEQIGYILSGEVEITIDTKASLCKSGMAYSIPAGVKHGFKVVSTEPLEYIEIFSPSKKENISK